MFESQIDWAATGSMIGGLASAATTCIAAAAAAFAYQQVREGRRLNAEDSYLDFHVLSFHNPQYARPDLAAIKKNPRDMTAYHWFVVGMLMSIERILAVFPNDPSWARAISDDLETHREYICSKEFSSVLPSFYPPVQAFISGFYRDHPSKAA